ILVLSATLPKIVSHLQDKRIDWLGAFFLTTTLVPLLLSFVWGGSVYEWTSWQIISSLAVAIISLVIFIYTEKKVRNPVLSLDLFQNKVFLVSVCALFLTAMAMFGAIMYVPIFSQGVIGGSATQAGLVLTPMMLSLVTASAISGQIISRTGKYKWLAVIGTAITVFSLFFFSGIGTQTNNIELMARMVILGLGLGSTMPIFTLAIQSAFSKERLGEVTAGSQLFRSVGGTVGTAILGGIMNYKLTQQAAAVQQEPFVAQMQQYGIGQEGNHFDPTMIQSVLNPENQQHFRDMFASIPNNVRPTVIDNFNHFLASSKVVYSHAIDSVFFTAGWLMVAALIIVFFLPEVELRKTDKPAFEEAGIMLEDELGNADDSGRRQAASFAPNDGRKK
ncbi:MAG TPA: MFS transporter, partial [Flavisolibacter sp.]